MKWNILEKLKEIDDQYGLIYPGMAVLDIGAAPGGWSQVIAEKLKLGIVCENIMIDLNLNFDLFRSKF